LRVTVTAAQSQKDIQEFLDVVGAVFNRDRPPRSADLRKGRVSIPDECYFLTTCVVGRQPLLAEASAAREIVQAFRWLRDQGRIRLLGFVVMPDHVHVALALRSRQECRSHERREDCGSGIPVATLAEVMKSLKGFTSRRLHQVCGIEPPIWQDGYHDHLLRDRRDFEKRLEYMHDNPRRLGLAKTAEEYPFSTAHPDYRHEIDWAWLEGVAP